MTALLKDATITDRLEAGKVLNLVLAASAQVLVTLTSSNGGQARKLTVMASQSIGPFASDQNYSASCLVGSADVSEAWRDQVPLGQNTLPVTASRALTASDFENVLAVANGVTLTLPNDATLGITDASAAPAIAFYPAGAGYTLDTSAVTMRGTAPTITQYVITGIVRVGANEWAYL